MRFFLFLSLLFVSILSPLAQDGVKENNLIGKIESEKNSKKRYGLQLELGKLYQVSNIKKADSIATLLISSSIVFNDSIRLSALLFKAETSLLNGDRSSYFKYVLECQPFLNRVNNEAIQLEINRHLATYHLLTKELETADFYIRRLLKTARSLNSKQELARGYLLLAQNYASLNERDSSLHFIDIAIQNARRTSNKALLSECFHQQALTYKQFNQLELGVAKDILALQIATEINHYRLMSLFSIDIGRSQYLIHNLKEAEYYFNQALEYAVKINDDNNKGTALVELATIYFNKKNDNEALSNCQKAIQIFEKYNNEEGLGNAYNTLGVIYREKQEFIKASSQFNKALIHFEAIGYKAQIANVYHNVGTVFYAQKKYDNALHYLNKAIEISKLYNYSSQLYSSYRVIADVYKSTGKTQKALEYMDLYANYMDSNVIEQATGKIAELNELYRAEQRDRLILSQSDSLDRQRHEKELTSAQLENVQLKNSFQTYFIIGFFVVAFLFGVIFYIRWNQTKIKQQQREAEMNQKLLRTQMNPHFVFNAMSVIQSYIYENDVQNSSKFLVNFSRLMRLILENSSKEEIRIELEEEILQKYLETQKLRFEDRFSFHIFIDEELRHENAMIPPMITQPFIENSIEHGQLHTLEDGFIHIYFRKNGDMLEVSIEDNGIGRKGAEKNKKSRDHKSMAMNITYERINNLNKKYKTEGYLLVEDYDKNFQTGTKVLISLPYRTETQTL